MGRNELNRRTVSGAALLMMLWGCASASISEAQNRRTSVPLRVVHLQRTDGFGPWAHVELTEWSTDRVTGRFWRSMSGSELAARRASNYYRCDFSLTTNLDDDFVCEPKLTGVDWRSVLESLDQSGIMNPPAMDAKTNDVCTDAPMWQVTVRVPRSNRIQGDTQECSIRDGARKRYSDRITNIITNIDAAARRSGQATIASLLPRRIIQVRKDGGISRFAYHFEILEEATDSIAGRFWRSSLGPPTASESADFGCTFTDAHDDANTWACEPISVTIDWREVRNALDRVGITHPPVDDNNDILICRDGTSWHISVRYPAAGRQFQDRQDCFRAAMGSARMRYEATVDSIVRAVDAHFTPRRK